MSFVTKKSLGQHFLYHPGTLDKIIALAKVSSEDHVLEIGPGPGGLTERLATKANQVVAIEKDSQLIEKLKKRFETQDNVMIIHNDALVFNYSDLDLLFKRPLKNDQMQDRSTRDDAGVLLSYVEESSRRPTKQMTFCRGRSWKVVANLPYNIATEIIFRLLEHRDKIREMYLMVQKEVAERLVASPGSKDYGVLSIMNQLYSENKIVMKLAPGAFSPPPKVHSAVVAFHVSDQCRYDIQNHDLFSKIVRTCFSQRRKMILNPLRKIFPFLSIFTLEETLKKNHIKSSQRPETIPVEQFANLANALLTLLDRKTLFT